MSEVWLFSLLIWYFKTAAYLKLDQLSLFQKGNQFCAHALSACLKWISTKADWGHLRSLLSYFWHWDRFLFDDNINQNWACWKDLLFTAVDECIPKRIPELHFSSVFTVDYYGNFPTADYVVVMRLESVNEVRNETQVWNSSLTSPLGPGPDNINCVLRECSSELAPSLAHILNKSFSSV